MRATLLVTALDGILGTHRTARGVRVVQRVFPSLFDTFGVNEPEDPEGSDEEAEFQQAVDLARGADVAVVVAGEWQNMIGEAVLPSVTGGELRASDHSPFPAVGSQLGRLRRGMFRRALCRRRCWGCVRTRRRTRLLAAGSVRPASVHEGPR